jgi:hypothetical protein
MVTMREQVTGRTEVQEAPTGGVPRELQTQGISTTAEVVAGGSLVEAVAGAGAVVLAIIGLAGILPTWMLTIATISAGAGLLLEGAAIAARNNKLIERLSEPGAAEFEAGMTAEFLGGAGAVALGILGLVGVLPYVLTSIAAIVLGGSLLVGAGATERINSVVSRYERQRGAHEHALREAVRTAAGAQVFVGMGVVVLGILGLVNFVPLTLSLVAMLSVGGALLLSGSTLCSRMVHMFSY